MPRRRASLLALVLLPLALVLTFVSVSVASAHPSHATIMSHVAKKAPKITIKGFAFKVPASVPAGAKIKLVNKDSVLHSVTSDNGAFTSVDVPPGGKATMIAPGAGSYAFHCRIHSSMKATLVVK